eukprot:792638-Pelagomonas_calceolata.AAC.3
MRFLGPVGVRVLRQLPGADLMQARHLLLGNGDPCGRPHQGAAGQGPAAGPLALTTITSFKGAPMAREAHA